MAKSASGALESVNIIKVTNLSMTLKKIRKKGFIIIGLDENSDVMLHNLNDYKNEKKVLVMGSEGKGLRRLTKENCDFLVSIANNNDSDFNTLNVSVSSALALYELMGRDINKIMEHITLPNLFFQKALENSDKPFLWAKKEGEWESLSWQETEKK